MGQPVVEGGRGPSQPSLSDYWITIFAADPPRIEDHWQEIYRGGFYRGGPILMNAIVDIA
jgi:galactonate dehydratase